MGQATRRVSARLNLLTARQVQHADDGDHTDGGGLMLRVRGASASWVLRYTAPNGKRREMGLGVARRGSPAQAGDSLTGARDAAHKAREQLRQSVDPLDARDAMREAAKLDAAARKDERRRERWTLARCARHYHERVIEPTKTPKHAAQWLASLENHVPTELWHSPIADVGAPALLSALLAVRPHERARNLTQGDRVQETVQRIRQRLEAIFEDATFHGLCSSNPAAAIRRKLREATPHRQKGEFKALPYREAPALVRQLRCAEGTAARCLELALLCVARTSEALLAEWSELDLEGSVWIIPAVRMKAKEPHTVYLSAQAVEILQAQVGQDSRLVFPSPVSLDRNDGDRKPLSNMALLAVLDRLDMRDRTTVHGLCRATFSTWANETAAARPDVIEACLAHEEGNRVRAAYNRAEFATERRALLAAWARYLATSNVVSMPRAA